MPRTSPHIWNIVKIALDSNVLVYASNEGSPLQTRAAAAIEELVESSNSVFVFWPVMLGFLRVATFHGLFQRPLTLDEALGSLEYLLEQPNVHAVHAPAEGADFMALLRSTVVRNEARGKLVHDAHLVALMKQHVVSTIWTNDRDFRRFDGIRVVNPLA